MANFKKSFGVTLLITSVIFLSAFTHLLPTSLKITVRNELGNTEAGVAVEIYETEEDYKNESNKVLMTHYTDQKGRVTFKDLKPRVYFVNAKKGDKKQLWCWCAD